jgi:hypothetical protein
MNAKIVKLRKPEKIATRLENAIAWNQARMARAIRQQIAAQRALDSAIQMGRLVKIRGLDRVTL